MMFYHVIPAEHAIIAEHGIIASDHLNAGMVVLQYYECISVCKSITIGDSTIVPHGILPSIPLSPVIL